MNKFTSTITGDFCITENCISRNLFSDELIELFNNTDLNITNLECPIISGNNEKGILKTGPHLYTTEGIFEQLKKLNINLVTMANNHIMDYGDNGLESTLKGCFSNHLITVGAGKNLQDAAQHRIIEKNGIKVAVVNFCENEWSIAKANRPGANPLDVIDNVQQIKKAKSESDKVMVIIHGGHEYYHLPSPRMKKQYRFFAENGADIVIGHHTHCISGHEVHMGIPIFYSLGNFIFTNKSKQEAWYTGLILRLEITKESPIIWELIPTRQSKEELSLSILKDEKKSNVFKEINRYNSIIANDKDLFESWLKFVDKNKKFTQQIFSATNGIPNRYILAVLRRLGVNNMILRKRYVTALLNNIRCEALYDVSKETLNSKLSQK